MSDSETTSSILHGAYFERSPRSLKSRPHQRKNQSQAIAGWRQRAKAPPRWQRDSSTSTSTSETQQGESNTRSRHIKTDSTPLRSCERFECIDSDSDESSRSNIFVVRKLVESQTQKKVKYLTEPIYDEEESFIKCPKTTFLLDCPELSCQICKETPLKIVASSQLAGDDATVILPCGHVSCRDCMDSWLSQNNSCPFCRVEMVHSCGNEHIVQPRVITYDTILKLPKTIGEGGKIGAHCADCRSKGKDDESRAEKLDKLIRKYQQARAEARERPTETNIEAMKKFKTRFDNEAINWETDKKLAEYRFW